MLQEIKKSLWTALWFVFLTFPIVCVKLDLSEKTIHWRWDNVLIMAISSFLLSIIWRYFLRKKEEQGKISMLSVPYTFAERLFHEYRLYRPILSFLALAAFSFPLFFSSYQTSIMSTTLMYIVLGLGLNIVVGLAGLLDLGYVAFYAVGAYSYALINYHFGLGFWTILPVGAILAAFFGILLGIPVLRLRGDYLAIVTLGFGEIIRLVLENWDEFSFGPRGITGIPKPDLFGIKLSLQDSTIYVYYLLLLMTLITIVVVRRLDSSRIGRAWVALREDEIACQAMGIDTTKVKLTAFALGAFWAGVIGVFFAAKNSVVVPSSFTFLPSAMILSIVVLGGMGSIVGVIIASFILILLPEYLRVFAEYRMLIFGAIMVVMMVFRPEGLIKNVRKKYEFRGKIG